MGATTLMTTQAQYTSCALFLSRWNEKRATMLTRGAETRHSSVDVSVQLSLESDWLNQSAVITLRILSLLPDGVLDEHLPDVIVHTHDCEYPYLKIPSFLI